MVRLSGTYMGSVSVSFRVKPQRQAGGFQHTYHLRFALIGTSLPLQLISFWLKQFSFPSFPSFF